MWQMVQSEERRGSMVPVGRVVRAWQMQSMLEIDTRLQFPIKASSYYCRSKVKLSIINADRQTFYHSLAGIAPARRFLASRADPCSGSLP